MIDFKNYKAQKTFAQKHMLTLLDYTKDEICQVLSLALAIKAKSLAGQDPQYLKGQTIALIFTKSSTRTRVSFERGVVQMGGHPLFLSGNDIQLGRGETIHDTAKVLSRMVSGIMIRTFAHSDVEDLAKFGTIPVINGLTDFVHPCQALADIMTMYEHLGDLSGKKLAFFGDGNNVCHSLMEITAILGIDFAAACPPGYEPDPAVTAACKKLAAAHGSAFEITSDPAAAMKDADAVYTDVWASMGQEAEAKVRLAALKNYAVTEELYALAKPGAIFLHCLPAHRGEEVVEAVIDGPNSVIFDQAENRLHAQKGLMALLYGGHGYEGKMKENA